jgi:hypothetical protein
MTIGKTTAHGNYPPHRFGENPADSMVWITKLLLDFIKYYKKNVRVWLSHSLMRTSPCWIYPRFDLLRVTSRHQLGLHVQDLVLFTISPRAPTPSIDIITRTSSSPAYDYFLNKYDYSVPRSITFRSLINYFNNSYDYF